MACEGKWLSIDFHVELINDSAVSSDHDRAEAGHPRREKIICPPTRLLPRF